MNDRVVWQGLYQLDVSCRSGCNVYAGGLKLISHDGDNTVVSDATSGILQAQNAITLPIQIDFMATSVRPHHRPTPSPLTCKPSCPF
jgi:hypothetical protein